MSELATFCKQLPKLELHAHLNGSIRSSTIRELAAQKGVDPALAQLTSKGDKTLAECFKLFDVIHRVTTDHATITRIAREVLEDMGADNVILAELRTTPKARPEHGMTKASYLGAVLAGLQAHRESASAGACQLCECAVVLSIDRRESTEQALDTVRLAAENRQQGVVGIDLSGNPSIGEWGTWEPALQVARQAGLKITLHAGEVYNPQETAAMLAFKPERLGHMCCLDAALSQQLAASRIPLELCLSSNVITKSVHCITNHHFEPLRKSGHPVVLCTDDSGVFNTSLSQEYAMAAQAFKLSRKQLITLAAASVAFAFADDLTKDRLTAQIAAFYEGLLV